MQSQKIEDFKAEHENRILTISMNEFVDVCAETMTEFDLNNPVDNFEEYMELQHALENFAKFSAVLTRNLFDGD